MLGKMSEYVRKSVCVSMWLCCAVMDDVYIYEFAVEFGFLRMSPKTRRRLNVTTKLVVLGESVDDIAVW